jgi:cell division protein FtsB
MKSRRKSNKIGKAFFRPLQLLAILILVVLIFVIVRGIYFRVQDERNINKGVEALKSEVEKFDQENKDLNKLVKYFDSVEFQEKEIKNKLNLVREGEKVVFVQGNRNNEGELVLDGGQEIDNIITTHANYYYWWKYFFNN